MESIMSNNRHNGLSLRGGYYAIPRQEAALETHIISLITSCDWDSLNPNSGQSVEIGNRNVCVAYHEDAHTGYRTWEWHGHFLKYDGRGGYTTEYFYGNYPQPMERKSNEWRNRRSGA